MPVLTFHLVASAYPTGALGALLVEASTAFAAALYPELVPVPVERVRAQINAIAPGHFAAGGRLANAGGAAVPYFTCVTLVGRPAAQIEAMMRDLCAITARHLGCGLDAVRGQVIPVEPDHWFIAGEPASRKRGAEIARRAQQT